LKNERFITEGRVIPEESVDKSFLEYGLAYNFRNVAPNF